MQRETIYWNDKESPAEKMNREFEVKLNGKTYWIREYNGDRYDLCNAKMELIESFDTYPEAQGAADRLAGMRKK